MKKLALLSVLFIFMICTPISQPLAKAVSKNFITRSRDRLMDGEKEFRFISFNIPNLHYIEDNLPFEETNPIRLPDEFEITDALKSVKQMGGQAVRIYTLSIRRADDKGEIPRHILGPGQFNEEAFKALDKVLEVANKLDIRVIIPFVDNWSWWGGVAEYAAFRGAEREAFWTDARLIADFKETIKYLINRTNVYTKVRYYDDKAILAWETGNELQCPSTWTREIATYIKSLDRNHLVIDGFHASVLKDESVQQAGVDIVTTHHYPNNPQEMIDQVRANREKSKNKKPYFVGEFGFVNTTAVRAILDLAIENGISGVLIWSLRFHDRDGGFYWHSEPFGGDLYKSYHWPGFAAGAAYDETNLLALMQQKAYQIYGLSVPNLEVPEPPVLLPIAAASAISWQGSAGAASYDLERASSPKGPWQVVGRDLSDAAVQYRPLFTDKDVELGSQYYYRARAKNAAGISQPSNFVGPVQIKQLALVDELLDFSLIDLHGGNLSFEAKEARKAKEDIHRLKGQKESFISYKLPQPISSWKVYSFFPAEVADFAFLASKDGKTFSPIEAERKNYYSGVGEYGYWKQVLYEGRSLPPEDEFFKIEFRTEAQISRIEINYEK